MLLAKSAVDWIECWACGGSGRQGPRGGGRCGPCAGMGKRVSRMHCDGAELLDEVTLPADAARPK